MKNIHFIKNNLNFIPASRSKEHGEDVMARCGSLASDMTASTRDGDYSTPYCSRGFKFFHAAKEPVKKSNIRKRKFDFEQRGKMVETNPFQGNWTNSHKINIWMCPSDVVVGTKFVNIFSGKSLFQVSNTQGQTVSVQILIFDGGVSANNYVTGRNVLVEANRSNEPSVLCQSTLIK